MTALRRWADDKNGTDDAAPGPATTLSSLPSPMKPFVSHGLALLSPEGPVYVLLCLYLHTNTYPYLGSPSASGL